MDELKVGGTYMILPPNASEPSRVEIVGEEDDSFVVRVVGGNGLEMWVPRRMLGEWAQAAGIVVGGIYEVDDNGSPLRVEVVSDEGNDILLCRLGDDEELTEIPRSFLEEEGAKQVASAMVEVAPKGASPVAPPDPQPVTKDTPKESFKSRLFGVMSQVGCLAILGLFVFSIYSSCSRSCQREHERQLYNDSVQAARDSIKVVEDSIAAVHNTPEYKDSVRIAQQKKKDYMDRSTKVIVASGDSCYHYDTDCFDGETISVKGLRITTRAVAKQMGLTVCKWCRERAEFSVLSGDPYDYVHKDEVLDYVVENYDVEDVLKRYDY